MNGNFRENTHPADVNLEEISTPVENSNASGTPFWSDLKDKLQDLFPQNPFDKMEHPEMPPDEQIDLPHNDGTITLDDGTKIELPDRENVGHTPNGTYEVVDVTNKTDDNGNVYMVDGKREPNNTYKLDGSVYNTDSQRRIISCDAILQLSPENTRDNEAQKEAGGEERRSDDDGGHIIAKIFGGADGAENLVAMRRTINRGDYKKMENEISKALQEGKPVTVHIDLTYDGDSQRPSKIHSEYTIDDKKRVVNFDNNEYSTELLDTLCDKIEEDDFNSLKAEIEDMANEGISSSMTSVKTEYNESGDPMSVTVGLLDEFTGEKTYKCFVPRKEQ